MIAYIALALAILAWGFEYPMMKSVTVVLGPLGTGAVMFTVATLLLGMQLGVRGGFRRDRLPDFRTFGYMALIGLIGFILNAVALLAIRLTSVTNVATLARADVLFSLALAALFFHEKIERSAWLATPLMLGGVIVLTGILSTPFGVGSIGDGLVLISAFLVALNAYIIRRVAQRINPGLIGFVNTAINSLLFLLSIVLFASHGEALILLRAGFTNPVALALGGLATLFFISYYTALKALPVWKVRLLMLLIPVVAAIGGRVWLGEIVTGVQMVGMAFVCTGAGWVIIAKHLDKFNGTTEQKEVMVCRTMKA